MAFSTGMICGDMQRIHLQNSETSAEALPYVNAMFLSVSFDSSWTHRALNVIVLAISSCVIFTYIHNVRKNVWIALAITVLFSCSTVMIDSVAYLSVSSVFYSLLASVAAYIEFEKAYNEKKRWSYAVGGLLLVMAFMLYQITTPIVFFMFMISIYEKREKDFDHFKKAFTLLIWYGIIALLYLLFSNGIMRMYGVDATQTERAQFVSSLPVIISKVKWFIGTVVPQTVTRSFLIYLVIHLIQQITCSMKFNLSMML